MKKGNRFLLPLFFLLTFFVVSDCVYAEEKTGKVCLDSGFYSIMWDSDISTNFRLGDVTESNIELGNTAPGGATDVETYKFEKTQIANKCYKDNDGLYYSCPTPEDLSISFNDFVKMKSDGTYQNITTKVNNDFTIKVSINNIYSKVSTDVTLRYVDKNNANTKELSLDKVSGGFLTLSNGKWVIDKVKPGSVVYIEVYIKKSTDSNCNGTMIGTFEFIVDDLNDYELDNPAIKSPSQYGCDVVKNNTKVSDDYKKSAVPECYSGKISYLEYKNLKNTIKEKWNKVIAIYDSFPDEDSLGASDFTCTEGIKTSTNTNLNISRSGKYWSLNCYESYTADPDGPKLVKAGGGFEYSSDFTVQRTCTISQISRPTRKTQCNVSYSSACTYPSGEITNINDPSRGGPDEDFDSCVETCDGGKYSQSCINSCYKQVYGSESDRQLNFTSQLNYGFNKMTLKPLVADPTSVKITKTGTAVLGSFTPGTVAGSTCGGSYPCISVSGKNRMCKLCTTTLDGHTFTNVITDYCGNRGTYCTYYKTVSPEGCSTNADGEYYNALAESERELRSFESIAASYENINNGDYEIQIQDSYLKDKNGKSYVFKVDSKNNPKVTIDDNYDVAEDSKKTVVSGSTMLGNSGGKSVTFNQKTVRTKTITVKLPASYVSRISSNIHYASDNDLENGYAINLQSSKTFKKVENFNVNNYYSKDYRYYTSLWSNNINVYFEGNYVKLQSNPDYPNNIKIISSNVGTGGGFSSDIGCYYGVYNEFYDKIEPDDCDPKKEICDGGIQWIYRPIELTDVFPNNREPRWNWTGTLNRSNHTYTGAARFSDQTTLRYNIDPVDLTRDIEAKGNTIFDVKKDASEVDYEFVLTKENLDNIRNYNKNVNDYNGDGYNNYMDYNMSCYKDTSGKEICTSRFLDNINANSGTESTSNFITYSVSGFTIDARKNIAGCNNSKSGACIEIGG